MTRSDNDSPPEGAAEVSHERAGPRSRLPIPARVKIGLGPSRDTHLRDVSVSGIRIDWPHPTDVGDAAIVRFEGYPGVCPAFILHGRVARLVTGRSPGLGIAIDREGSSAEALQHLRLLVLHYLRHKPLLDKLERDFFEGRCEACDWLGRVGARSPVCPRCGRRVRALDSDQ